MSGQRAPRSLKAAGANDLAHSNPRVLTDLCLIREETSAELRRRVDSVDSDAEARQRRTEGAMEK